MPYSSPVVSPKSGLVEHQACRTAVGAVTNTERVMDTAVTHQQAWWHSPTLNPDLKSPCGSLCCVQAGGSPVPTCGSVPAVTQDRARPRADTVRVLMGL